MASCAVVRALSPRASGMFSCTMACSTAALQAPVWCCSSLMGGGTSMSLIQSENARIKGPTAWIAQGYACAESLHKQAD